MKALLLLPLLSSFTALADINWAQPKVACVEEVTPREPEYPCLDLSEVNDPTTDFPADMPAREREMWMQERKPALRICRAHEVLRREEEHPGSMGPNAVELSWMRVLSTKSADEKIDAIYDAANEQAMPPQILFGALMQESLMADLGIAEDGGNFSCGIAQLNVSEFCRWAEQQPIAKRIEMGWPIDRIAAWKAAHSNASVCSGVIYPELVRPTYRFGLEHLNGLPEYRLLPEHLEGIRFEDVVSSYPSAPEDTQRLRFEVVTAFSQACSKFEYSIPAKASALREIYDEYIPAPLKKLELYKPGQKFARACKRQVTTNAYPEHTGWLLADSIYNAGPSVIPAITWYQRMTPESARTTRAWKDLHPKEIIHSLYWAGAWNPNDDKLYFKDLQGSTRTLPWQRACIGQRHLARVIQHATLGDNFVDTLEPAAGCKKSVYDASGKLVSTTVPQARQKSSGQKDLPQPPQPHPTPTPSPSPTLSPAPPQPSPAPAPQN